MKRLDRRVRQSQTIAPFGVGAIFDIQGESFVACDIYEWGNRGEPVVSSRLTGRLRVRGLRAAETVDESPFAKGGRGIPYARFPSWLFCQKCRAMTSWSRAMEQDGQAPTCGTCAKRRQLVPMRWVQICKKGHLSDVNWKYWAHWGASLPDQKQCERYDRLAFETVAGRGGGGLDTLRVRCRACNASRALSGITGSDTLTRMGVKCEGRQPWQSRGSAEECTEPPRAAQRGASNVYFPVTHSSIEIPMPEADDTESDVALAIRNTDLFPALLRADENAHVFSGLVEMIAEEVGVDDDDVVKVARAEKARDAGIEVSPEKPVQDLLEGEWAAFLSPDAGNAARDFVTRHVELLTSVDAGRKDLQLLRSGVGSVVVADRLREVRALEGFHRVAPAGGETLVRASLNRKLDWLPAVEVYGEGIFLSLDETRLSAWEQRDDVRARVEEMAGRLTNHFMADRLLDKTGTELRPRYVLLHTLGHLLVRRLAFESGYSAASLRERVYAKSGPSVPGAVRQAGVLVYTAAGDAEGTLGGLARQGEPGHLSATLVTLLEEATWCSADPLCSENRAQGFGSLNYAACHACCLISETSCEAANSLLDRALLVGGPDVGGFFQGVVEATTRLAVDATGVAT
jgi:hypothetical protein